MKNNIKILIASCLMLVCAANVSAQWRFGVEQNTGFMKTFYYDNNGVFENSDRGVIISGFFTTSYYLPRTWTPYWMSLNIRSQIGFSDIQQNNIFSNNDFYYENDLDSDIASSGATVCIGPEINFLLSKNIRFFINASLINHFSEGYDNKHYFPGMEYGAGLELGFFRVGYKNVNFNTTFVSKERGNKYNNVHTFSVGFVFNGNRFLKKKSSLKAY